MRLYQPISLCDQRSKRLPVKYGLIVCFFVFMLTAISLVASAQTPVLSDTAKQNSSIEKLRELKQNPVSGLKQILFEANMDPGYPSSGQMLGIYSLQIVWPFSLGSKYRLVTYTILPTLNLPQTSGSSIYGLSNTLINMFLSLKKAGVLVWGFGPTIMLPTRTDPALGSNSVALGPAALIYYPSPSTKWNLGVVMQNGWSLGGGSGINDVNAFGAQYLFSYNLPKGWSIYSNSTITANWTKQKGERWTVPVGGGFGKLFMAGKLPISISLQSFYNVVTPTGGANWSANIQLAFLFAAPQ